MIRVLLVDDEAGFTTAVKLNLQATGKFEVEAINQGSQALAKALEFRPDIAILDIVMPDMDGGDVARQIRTHPQLQSVKILFLTALVKEGDVSAGNIVEAGEDVMIAKPVTADRLTQCIEAKLAGEL